MLSDPTFWALVGLILFLALLVYLRVPGQLNGALDNRAKAIRDELEEAKKLRGEAEALLADYKRRAVEATNEASAIVDQAKREAEALTAEARQRLEEYVSGRTRLAEQKIAQAEQQAVQEVRALSADVAVAAAEKILAAKVKGEAATALVEQAISDVRSKLN